MADKDHSTKWGEMAQGLRDAGMVSYALVAVDQDGEVYWGADFAAWPKELLHRLRTIDDDITDYVKRPRHSTGRQVVIGG